MRGKLSVEEIDRALAKLALIMERCGHDSYWPIFERLEREREALTGRKKRLERAKERLQKASG